MGNVDQRNIIPAADLPLQPPGGKDYVLGVVGASRTLARFDVNQMPLPEPSRREIEALKAAQQVGSIYAATLAELQSFIGTQVGQGGFVTGGQDAGQYHWTGNVTGWKFLRADILPTKADQVDVDKLAAGLSVVENDQSQASGYIGRFSSDMPLPQMLPSVDVRLAQNWRAATAGGAGAEQSVEVVSLDALRFPVAGLFGAKFALQSNTLSQRVEIISPFFSPVDLSDAGVVAGDVLTMAVFCCGMTVNPFDQADLFDQFGFIMGVNSATIQFTNRVRMGNGWECFFVQRVITSADLVDGPTSGSINGIRLRTKAAATQRFAGVIACPMIFRGPSVGFIRYLQGEPTAISDATRGLVVDNQLRGEVVAFVGDSRTVQGLGGTGYRYYTNRSYPFWLRCLSRQAFDTTAALNFGQSGWRTDQILEALPGYIASMKAARVRTACVLCSTNDRNALNPATGATYTAAGSLANVAAICAALVAAGIRVVLMNETPRSDLGGSLKAEHVAVRDGLKLMHSPKDWITVADTWSGLASAEDPNAAASWATVDGVHMTVDGCWVMGAAVWAAMQNMQDARDILPADDFQIIARNGNMMANSLMLQGSGVADSWGFTNNAGGTAAAVSSLVTLDAKRWQKALISGTPSGSDSSPLFLRWTQNLDPYKDEFQIGDVLDAALEVRVEAPVGVRSVDFFLVGPGVFDGAADIGAATTGYRLGNRTWGGVLRTLPIQISAQLPNLQMRVRIVLASGVECSGAVYWRAAVIRRRNR